MGYDRAWCDNLAAVGQQPRTDVPKLRGGTVLIALDRRAVEIVGGAMASFWVIVKKSNGVVALFAQQAANSSCRMTVIDDKPISAAVRYAFSQAYRALATLGFKQTGVYRSYDISCQTLAERPLANIPTSERLISAWLAPDVKSIRTRCIADKVDYRSINPTLTASFPGRLRLSRAPFFPCRSIPSLLSGTTRPTPSSPCLPRSKIALKIGNGSVLFALRARSCCWYSFCHGLI